MSGRDYTESFTVNQTPDEVFRAVNDVAGWWSGNVDGKSDRLGAEFVYRYEDIHVSRQKVTEFVPGKRVVWHVTDADVKHAEDRAEWKGTDITFDIAANGGKTEVRFTHVGLSPALECFERCSGAWRFLIGGSLRSLIASGEGRLEPL